MSRQPEKVRSITPEEQFELVENHYALNASGDYPAAQELLTDDFFITIPPYLPFAGVYRGKGAFRELNPIVVETLAVTGMRFVRRPSGAIMPSRLSSLLWPEIPVRQFSRRADPVSRKSDLRDPALLLRSRPDDCRGCTVQGGRELARVTWRHATTGSPIPNALTPPR